MRHNFFGRRSAGAATASLALLALAPALVLTLGGGSSPLRLAERVSVHCRPGTMPADGANAGGSDKGAGGPAAADAGASASACQGAVPLESFADLSAANTQLGARDAAPFATVAAGAYPSAVAQRAKLLRAARAASDPTATAPWTVAGSPPECGSETSDGTTCPPASAENGQYNGVGSLGFRTLSGRISSLAYDPSTPGRLFASPVVGGVWESRDSGATWKSIGDTLPTQVVGAIAYDTPLHRIIVGSGDNSFGGDGIAGHGIFYSDDDGASWQTAAGVPDLALSFKVVVSPADTSGKTIYAATSRGLFRSTDGGATYQNELLPTSPAGYSPNCQGDTSTPLCFFANDVTDVIVKPTATANGPAGAVIAAVGWRAGQKVDTDASGNDLTTCKQNGAATNCLQAPQNGLYTSSSGNPGSFSYITPTTGGVPGTGLPAIGIFGRTALAVAHGVGQNSDAVYALVQDAQKFDGCPDVLDQVPPATACNATATGEGLATVLNGLFVSYDFGKSWTKIMDSNQLKDPGDNSSLLGQPGYGPGVQAWYNLWVDADPVATDASTKDPTRVIFGLEEIWENNQLLPTDGTGGVLSTPYPAYPGGTSANDPWVVIGRYWNACGAVNSPVPCNNSPLQNNPIPGSTTHPDQHADMIIPDGKGGETLYAGSDGGAFAQHIAAGADFNNDNWGDGLNKTISAVQPYDAEISKDGTIVSGLQDNGEMKTAPDGHESEIYGGDAFYTTIDPANSNNILEEYTYGATSLSNDGGASWFSVAPGSCSSSTALFSTPLEQDPTQAGHILEGCTQLQEATNAYANPCTAPAGASSANCAANGSPFVTTFDLSTLPAPNGATNIPSALAVRGPDEYVGYCGYCDPAVEHVPFANGIATNVGGSAPPQIGTTNGWHQAKALCSDCRTANGLLPERYITSIQEVPGDPNAVIVTEGGYGRRWIPPGSFGEDVSNVGVGHVFISVDHGEHFTNITGNLPDISANWTTFHDGRLVVATDLGVYIADAGSTAANPTYSVLGSGLPAVPVFTVRTTPADPNRLLIATYGRGDWFYEFPASSSPGNGTNTSTTPQPPPPKGTSGKCPRPSGSFAGGRLGPLHLGMTRAAARKRLPHFRAQRALADNFCLAGGAGIRVIYPSAAFLRHLGSRKLSGRIVLGLTANSFYAVDGVRPGTAVGMALRRVHARKARFNLGVNTWYVFRAGSVSGVFKVRHGRVEEVGSAYLALTSPRRMLLSFFKSFGG